MIGLSHVILNVALCAPLARAKPETVFAMRVRMYDHKSNVNVDKTVQIERGDDDSPKIVEFDIAQGTYRLDVRAPKYGCAATDYLAILPDHGRSVTETLATQAAPPGEPLLMEGGSPQSFLYVQPTFVLLDKSVTDCNKPVGDLLPMRTVVENDQDAYYAWLYPDPAANGHTVQLALRLKTPTHQYHYVRVPIPFPAPWGGWPENVRFDVTQSEIDDLASQPVGTLLCLRLWETKVYY